jgi:hypothetical protein
LKQILHRILFFLLIILSLQTTKAQEKENNFELLSNKIIVTIYHANRIECDEDFLITANNFHINEKNPYKDRILAIDLGMFAKYNLKFGDIVYIEGIGEFDGLWQIQDVMNERYRGKDKIDILVDKSVKAGLWRDVKIYKVDKDALIINPFSNKK